MTSRHLLAAIALPLCLIVLAGCTKKSAASKVTGTVTYNGAPVTGGNLAFRSDAGAYTAVIGPDGKYTITDMPAGEFTVTVDTEGLNPNVKKQSYGGGKGGVGGSPAPGGKGQTSSPMPEGAADAKAGTYVKIPRNYADPTKTTLKYSVKDGTQTIDIALKD